MCSNQSWWSLLLLDKDGNKDSTHIRHKPFSLWISTMLTMCLRWLFKRWDSVSFNLRSKDGEENLRGELFGPPSNLCSISRTCLSATSRVTASNMILSHMSNTLQALMGISPNGHMKQTNLWSPSSQRITLKLPSEVNAQPPFAGGW